MAACPMLRVLNLNDNHLGFAGAMEIASALGSNLTLHELHIEKNQITDKGEHKAHYCKKKLNFPNYQEWQHLSRR